MDLRTSKEEQHFIVEVDGDLDASSSIVLDTALRNAIDANEKFILVDCTKLQYISSPGLGVFMSYLRELDQKGACLLLYNMNEKVNNTFRILGLDKLIQIVASKEEAKAACLHNEKSNL